LSDRSNPEMLWLALVGSVIGLKTCATDSLSQPKLANHNLVSRAVFPRLASLKCFYVKRGLLLLGLIFVMCDYFEFDKTRHSVENRSIT